MRRGGLGIISRGAEIVRQRCWRLLAWLRSRLAGYAWELRHDGLSAVFDGPIGERARSLVRAGEKLSGLVPLPRGLRSEDRVDLEFLDPASEIRLSPPSPIRVTLAITICAFVVLALAISAFSKVDVYAVAQGRVQPAGRSKVIQPLYQGIVQESFVQNGTHVSAGARLVALDPTEAKAELDETARQFVSLNAEIARRQAALAAARSSDLSKIPSIAFPPGTDSAIESREQGVLEADLQKLSTDLAMLQSKMGENRAQKIALEQTIRARKLTIQVLQQRVQMRSNLALQGWESKSNVLDAVETLDRERSAQVSDRGQLLQNIAAMTTLVEQKTQTTAQFISDYSQALEKAEKDRDDIIQNLVKVKKKAEEMILRAPVDGAIQQLSVTTIGQVVQPGEQLMTIVPSGTRLEMEVLVLDQDIGFVRVGQSAVIKIDSFPFTRYGTISGTVVRVSKDAVADTDEHLSSDTQQAPVSAKSSGATPVPKTQNLIYPVTVAMDSSTMIVDGKKMPLVPGMTATVEIKTDRRSVLDYVLSPLLRVTSEAIHER